MTSHSSLRWFLPKLSFWVALWAPLMGGCSYQLFSPPSRMVNMETARTAAPGETVVGARAAGHSAIFNPGVAVVSGGVRRGVAERLEVDVDATWGHLFHDSHPNINRNIYAARVGGKMSNAGGSAALLSGLGGGYAPAGGGFTAADVGFAVSYPNCYVLPFLNGTTFASVPIAAKRVQFRNDDSTLVASDTATTTLGLGVSTGIEIPLARARCRSGLTAPRIQLGASLHTLFSLDGGRVTKVPLSGASSEETKGRLGAFGLGVGVEFPF